MQQHSEPTTATACSPSEACATNARALQPPPVLHPTHSCQHSDQHTTPYAAAAGTRSSISWQTITLCMLTVPCIGCRLLLCATAASACLPACVLQRLVVFLPLVVAFLPLVALAPLFAASLSKIVSAAAWPASRRVDRGCIVWLCAEGTAAAVSLQHP